MLNRCDLLEGAGLIALAGGSGFSGLMVERSQVSKAAGLTTPTLRPRRLTMG